jgi:4-diphosphocytidyl-2-C-methyl-D-erythritol kinase
MVAAMGTRLAAPAKVNLHLEVLDRRADGFHDLRSLFQAVDLADTLRLERTGSDGPVTVRGMPELPRESDLVVRAIELFRRRAGVREGVAAEIDKRIPIGAGFGGGSSDAAAALRCLQALFGSPLDEAALDDCAQALGSDVPFFLHGAAARVEGRGERVHRLAPRTDFTIVAATPEESVATADAFAWLDADRGAGRATGRVRVRPAAGDARALERAYLSLSPDEWPFGSSFDESVAGRRPAVAALLDRIEACGAAAHLTGSGSTVIALFSRRERAAACCRSLAADPPPGTASGSVRLLAPLASLPRVEYYG